MSQTEFALLEYESIPCWHEISFDSETLAMTVSVHGDFLRHLPLLAVDFPIVGFAMKECGLKEFHGDFQGPRFGFNGAPENIGERDGFVRQSVKIPVLERFHVEICRQCQGHGRDLFDPCDVCGQTGRARRMLMCSSCEGAKEDDFGDECRYCQGKGKRPDSWMDWDSFFAISATFSLFFELMARGQDRDKITSCSAPQLILITTGTQRGMHGCPISGTYGIELVNWLIGQQGEIPEVTDAMRRTWEKAYGSFDAMDQMHTRAEVRTNGWLGIGCPGDRAGLHPNFNGHITQGRGFEFSDHNVDTPLQQLTLLAGLGALCNKARQEMRF